MAKQIKSGTRIAGLPSREAEDQAEMPEGMADDPADTDLSKTDFAASEASDAGMAKPEAPEPVPLRSGTAVRAVRADTPRRALVKGQREGLGLREGRAEGRGGKRAAARAAELRAIPAGDADDIEDIDISDEVSPAIRTPATRIPGTAGRIRPVAVAARPRRRHRIILWSFLLIVLLPVAVAGWYLWTRTVDQYASYVSFSVRKEDSGSSLDVLGGLGGLAGLTSSGSSDTDILYQFMQSQELLSRLDKELGLRALYSRPHDVDPVFALAVGATIEDLVDYWPRIVKIIYDPGTGLMELRVQAFDPDDAQKIAQTIFSESSAMINRLSDQARLDATRYAREELDLGLERLKTAREAITAFRSRTQIVDPSADIQGQMGLLNTLQAQLATSLIELDLLRQTTIASDPRISQGELRIQVIQARIDEERSKFGVGGQGRGGEDYATIAAEFERLNVDLEFAEAAYKSALSAYDGAQAEAQRQTRYLAAHVEPTRAESARFPQRGLLLGLVGLFCLLAWAIGVLIFYSIRDRR